MHAARVVLLALADPLDHDLAQVDADAVAQRGFVRSHRIAKGLLEPQRKQHGIGGPCEDQEERVARRADLGRLGKFAKEPPYQLMVLLDPSDPEPIAQALLELGRAHQVGEHQRHQPGLVLAAEGLDPALVADNRGPGSHALGTR